MDFRHIRTGTVAFLVLTAAGLGFPQPVERHRHRRARHSPQRRISDFGDINSTTVSRQVRGTVHRLDVTRKPTRPPGGPYALRIRTDHPDQPAVEVPYILLEKAP